MIDPIYENVGLNIKALRKQAKMSQDELGSKSELSRATIAAIEMGKQTVAIHQLVAICRALNTTFEQIVPDLSDQGIAVALAARDVAPNDRELIKELMSSKP